MGDPAPKEEHMTSFKKKGQNSAKKKGNLKDIEEKGSELETGLHELGIEYLFGIKRKKLGGEK